MNSAKREWNWDVLVYIVCVIVLIISVYAMLDVNNEVKRCTEDLNKQWQEKFKRECPVSNIIYGEGINAISINSTYATRPG